MNIIDSFDGEHRWLSNFWPCTVALNDAPNGQPQVFSSVEHAYQAAKTLDASERRAIAAAETPGKAKRLGRSLTLAPDWDNDTRLTVMSDLLRQKFGSGPLRAALAGTGDALIIEGNTWHDQFWGVCSCGKCRTIEGLNHLGEMLMEIRSEITP